MDKPLIIIADPDTDRSDEIAATFNGTFACIRVTDAHEALAQIRERRPAAVVLDFPFPIGDHQCLSAAIHEDMDINGMPVIAYSGWNYPKTRAKAEGMGCTAFVAHEEGAGKVVDTVKGILRKHRHAVA